LQSRPHQNIDNGYAYLLAKFGLIGTLIFAFLYIALIKESYRLSKQSNQWRFLSIALFCILLLGLLFAIAGGNIFYNRAFSYCVGVFAGLITALDSEKQNG